MGGGGRQKNPPKRGIKKQGIFSVTENEIMTGVVIPLAATMRIGPVRTPAAVALMAGRQPQHQPVARFPPNIPRLKKRSNRISGLRLYYWCAGVIARCVFV